MDYLQPLEERGLFVGRSGQAHAADTLRHVFASELLVAGANLRQIQELLGPQAPRLDPASSPCGSAKVGAGAIRCAISSATRCPAVG